jgi:hypothetical protein
MPHALCRKRLQRAEDYIAEHSGALFGRRHRPASPTGALFGCIEASIIGTNVGDHQMDAETTFRMPG